MIDTPRTDAAYDRAEETVSKFRREDLRKQAEIDELDKECRQLERELAEAKEREEKLKTMLLDPTTVHINMMRGTIAKLDWPTLEHIHGNHPLRAQRDALLEALDTLTLVVGLTPIAGNMDALQEAMDSARREIALAKGGGQ